MVPFSQIDHEVTYAGGHGNLVIDRSLRDIFRNVTLSQFVDDSHNLFGHLKMLYSAFWLYYFVVLLVIKLLREVGWSLRVRTRL